MHEFLTELIRPVIEVVVDVVGNLLAQFMSWRLIVILILTAVISGGICIALGYVKL